MQLEMNQGRSNRRAFCRDLLGLSLVALCAGCDEEPTSNHWGRLDKVWGRRGVSFGRFQKPRAMAIDEQDLLYIVDMKAQIQIFDTDGNYLRGWRTPDHAVGKPTGLSIDRQGRVLVADTHYYQLLVYDPMSDEPDGKLLQKIGGTMGSRPGEFGLVTDAVQDRHGYYYISEYGEYDRIQKFTPDGEFVLQWGGHGSAPGQFVRPQNMAIDDQDRIWVTDACNHRIQVFDTAGKLLLVWGEQGSQVGQLSYPYDLQFDHEGNLFVIEFGNHRVQKFTPAGQSLGCWGREGRGEGELFNPWAIVLDSQKRLHVLDSNNHRVQRVIVS
jgi:DNA-binding beta-propeller fold protein YncE